MYVDKYGLYNVKPVVDGNPSGNDGWIITAYAIKLGLPVEREKILQAYDLLKKDQKGMPLERLPNKATPYLSRDVILGLVYLKILTVKDLEDWEYSFSPFPLPKFNFFQAVKQFWGLKGKHRNHFWQNPGFEQVYRFAFSVPIGDRYAMQKKFGKPTLFQKLWGFFDFILKPDDDSSKLIHWLKYEEVPDRDVFIRYFGENHPITLQFLNSPLYNY